MAQLVLLNDCVIDRAGEINGSEIAKAIIYVVGEEREEGQQGRRIKEGDG